MESKSLIFVAGSVGDPKPARNEPSKRYARCLTCNRIVHFSRAVMRWVFDDGTFHTGHLVEFPIDWLPANLVPALVAVEV